jgi:hypothetical protein
MVTGPRIAAPRRDVTRRVIAMLPGEKSLSGRPAKNPIADLTPHAGDS